MSIFVWTLGDVVALSFICVIILGFLAYGTILVLGKVTRCVRNFIGSLWK